MKKFDYYVLQINKKGSWNPKFDFEEMSTKINELGNQGWELTSNISNTVYQGATQSMILIFKKEK
jgi:hypothetical protein